MSVQTAAKKTVADVTKVDKANPLVKWSVGGIGSAVGIWLYTKIYRYLNEKYPDFLSDFEYKKPLLKTITALLLYFMSQIKQIKNLPLAPEFFFGAGVGVFGSMVVDFVVEKYDAYGGDEVKTNKGTTQGSLARSINYQPVTGLGNTAIFA